MDFWIIKPKETTVEKKLYDDDNTGLRTFSFVCLGDNNKKMFLIFYYYTAHFILTFISYIDHL